MTASRSQAHRSEFGTAVSEMGEGIGQIKEDLGELAHSAVNTAKAGLSDAKQGVSRSIQMAKEKGSEATDVLRKQVKSRPLTYVGLAAGLGLLAGMFIFRPRS
ncbi:MAG TPA: hypothetical protein VG797_04160 [Phycisphaerales bacterium]|nr:hypothetical protein [Phycisphaerales bacterium]